MEDEILSLAQALTGAAADDALLKTLCRAAEAALQERLRPGMASADCGGIFPSAAALLATADWREARQWDEGGVSFRAGEVSVTAQPAAERAESVQALRTLSWRIMAPYIEDGGFSFRGVWA